MNPSTALATVLLDELLRCGVRELVLCPGSRSAPLAYAALAAERAGRLRLHVRVDERSAGFLALGLAKVSRRPAAVVTTSGTAVANLHPAVLEAHHAAVPLLLLTADRPTELRGTGANQTTVQPGMYAGAVRWEHDVPAADQRSGQQQAWRTLACRGVAAATGAPGGLPGPVHLNVAFRDPLPPELPGEPHSAGTRSGPDDAWEEPLEGRPDGRPWVRVSAVAAAVSPGDAGSGSPAGAPPVAAEPRTVLVLGDLPDPASAAPALELARRCGWPVVAEPFGGGDRSGVVPHGPTLLADERLLADHPPRRVLVVGRPTLSRDVGRLVRLPGMRIEQVAALPQWSDPAHVVETVHPWSALRDAVAGGALPEPDREFAEAWRLAGDRLADAVGPVLERSWPSGPAVAAAVLEGLQAGDTLVVGSSAPARDVDLAANRLSRADGVTVVGNRGLAGIDGTVSTAVGVALATAAGRTVALMGDLTFLHDANGLLMGPDEPCPDLTVVVVNDDGGGIFTTLEYGEESRAADFERVFGTPTGTDLGALCRAHGVRHDLVGSRAALVRGLRDRSTGVRVLEVRVDRAGHRALRAELGRAVSRAGGTG